METFHDRIRETVLASLPAPVAHQTNRQLALTLEAAGHADPETLAVHFEGAEEPDLAGVYYALAADSAASALAFDRAASLYRRSLVLRLWKARRPEPSARSWPTRWPMRGEAPRRPTSISPRLPGPIGGR